MLETSALDAVTGVPVGALSGAAAVVVVVIYFLKHLQAVGKERTDSHEQFLKHLASNENAREEERRDSREAFAAQLEAIANHNERSLDRIVEGCQRSIERLSGQLESVAANVQQLLKETTT